MNMKRIFLGILAALFMIGCTTEEAEVTAEQDMSFLEPSEQARLWNKIASQGSNTSDKVAAKGQCTDIGRYEASIFVQYTGGGTGRSFSRFWKVLSKRYELSIKYRVTPTNPCPSIRLPLFPQITYNSSEDSYEEIWESYLPSGGDPGPRARKVPLEDSDDSAD